MTALILPACRCLSVLRVHRRVRHLRAGVHATQDLGRRTCSVCKHAPSRQRLAKLQALFDSSKIQEPAAHAQGVWEKDAERKDDSFNTFEEVMQLAVEQDVDMLLLGGDLFHDNKPSRTTVRVAALTPAVSLASALRLTLRLNLCLTLSLSAPLPVRHEFSPSHVAMHCTLPCIPRNPMFIV